MACTVLGMPEIGIAFQNRARDEAPEEICKVLFRRRGGVVVVEVEAAAEEDEDEEVNAEEEAPRGVVVMAFDSVFTCLVFEVDLDFGPSSPRSRLGMSVLFATMKE